MALVVDIKLMSCEYSIVTEVVDDVILICSCWPCVVVRVCIIKLTKRRMQELDELDWQRLCV